MIKKILLTVIVGCVAIFLLGYLGLYLIGGTGIFWTLKDSPGCSESIEDSREKGVYMETFIPQPSRILLGNGRELTIGEVWMEKRWIYGEYDAPPRILKGTWQLIINTNRGDDGYCKNWVCAIDSADMQNVLRPANPALIYDNLSRHIYPMQDTIAMYCYKINDYISENSIRTAVKTDSFKLLRIRSQ